MKTQKKYFYLILSITLILIHSQDGFTQAPCNCSNANSLWHEVATKIHVPYKVNEFKYVPKKPGHYTAAEWRTAIDTTWGEGRPTAEKLQIFDTFWKEIDERYAGFNNLNINWDSLRTVFRPEIEAGVSRGRFYGILSYLCVKLQDTHTRIIDLDIFKTELKPGLPLLVHASEFHAYEQGHFGAGLTPLPDSTVLVYQVVPNHPLNLKPGDIVLGYNNVPWKNLYRELIDAQLPITGIYNSDFGVAFSQIGSSDYSFTHRWLMSAGLNWHLFDTIDIIKYGSGDTLHLPTNLLENQNMQIFCTEQLPVEGVALLPDWENRKSVSWGIVEGTNIGYIYVWSWLKDYNTHLDFSEAVYDLLNNHKVDGLILDYRSNVGGDFECAVSGYRQIFNSEVYIFETAYRSNKDDHFALTPRIKGKQCSLSWVTDVGGKDLFERPIALLVGPASRSMGDYNSLLMKYHPMSKIFGKPTNTGYGCISSNSSIDIEYSEWQAVLTDYNAFLIDQPGEYLNHVGFEIDEDVWLGKDDVARGEDSVVKRAMEWIQNLVYSHNVALDKTYARPIKDSVFVSAIVENPNQHELSVLATITHDDSVIVDSFYLFNDGAAGDSIWGGFTLPVYEEQTYQVSVKTEDLTSGTSRTLPNVVHFTSVGPLVFENYTITSSDTFPNPGDALNVKLDLKNLSASISATEIKARMVSLDSMATITRDIELTFGDIEPGESAAPTFTFATIGVTIAENSPVNVNTFFRIEISSNNHFFWSDTFSIFIKDITGGITDKENKIPLEFALEQNYPNPFNPLTTINFTLPKTEFVTLKIFNILGEEIATIVNNKLQAGNHTYQFDGSNLASGIYLYRIEAREFQEIRKMLLIK